MVLEKIIPVAGVVVKEIGKVSLCRGKVVNAHMRSSEVIVSDVAANQLFSFIEVSKVISIDEFPLKIPVEALQFAQSLWMLGTGKDMLNPLCL